MDSEAKVFTKEQVLEQSKENPNNLYIVIHDRLYDVTKFADEHPGGEETLKEHQIKEKFIDATESFEDVGHSMDARDLLKKYLVGSLESTKTQVKAEAKIQEKVEEVKSGSFNSWILVAAIGIVAIGLAFFFKK